MHEHGRRIASVLCLAVVAGALVGLGALESGAAQPSVSERSLKLSRTEGRPGDRLKAFGRLPSAVRRAVVLQSNSTGRWRKVTGGRTSGAGRFALRSEVPETARATLRFRVVAPRVRVAATTYARVVTPTVTLTVVPPSAPIPSPTASPTSSPTVAPPPSPTATPTPTPQACSQPVWVSSLPDDMYFESGYVVHNNMWNASGYDVEQTTSVCSYDNWSTTITADNSRGDRAVKTFPNVHKDYHDWATGEEPLVSSFSSISSTFAHESPGAHGIYNFAFDVWLNGVPGGHEIMVWTENRGQGPAGSFVGQVAVGGRTWDLFASAANAIVTFRPSGGAILTSGTLDLKQFLDYLTSAGRVPPDATLGQICYGVEVVSTDGVPATFDVTEFEVTDAG